MGLDIYLYKYDNFERTVALEEEYERRSEENWYPGREYEDLTEEEIETARAKNKALQEELGLGEYGEDTTNKHSVDTLVSKYPDHLFNLSYWHSSYNDSGINRKLYNWIGEDLYSIAGNSSQEPEYRFKPDWKQVKANASKALKKLRKHFKENGVFNVFEVSFNQLRPLEDSTVSSTEEAMALYLKETKKDRSFVGDCSSYSNLFGSYFPDGLEIVALINGRQKAFFSNHEFPSTFVVYKAPKGDGEFYEQALEIMMETCDFVLSQPDPEKYCLHWSG